MRYLLLLFLLLYSGLVIVGQSQSPALEGSVNYITSQSVYVKFNNTANIKSGDTLFIHRGDSLVPVLKVKDLSSTSCVCIPLAEVTFKVSDKVFFKTSRFLANSKDVQATPAFTNSQEHTNLALPVEQTDSTSAPTPAENKKKQQIRGFINLSSSSGFSSSTENSQSEKLTF